MPNIKIALSEKNLASGDRIKNFDLLRINPLIGSATIDEVSENFVSAILDDGHQITFDAKSGGNLSELMKAWDKSTNTELVQVGDRGYTIQQHTGMPFTYTVIEVVPGNELVIKYDDPARHPETKNSISVSVDQKMERYISGTPALNELTHFAPRKVEGFEEKVRSLMAYIKAETPLFSSPDEQWNDRLFENSIIAFITKAAWSENEEISVGAYLNDVAVSVQCKANGKTVDIVSAEAFPGSNFSENEMVAINKKLAAYFA